MNKKIIYISVIVVVVIILCFLGYGILEKIALKTGKFTVSVEKTNGLVMYEELSTKNAKTYLKAGDIDFFSDISVNWLPKNIDSEAEGMHNGRNYIAHTFYVENMGRTTTNYTATIQIDDVLEELDEIIRIMVIKNGNKTIYAKENKDTGTAELNTTPFYNQDIVMLESTVDFNVGDIDKYTVVIWAEGDDSEALNKVAASGNIKIHMNLKEN